jgi:hypothetical protein
MGNLPGLAELSFALRGLAPQKMAPSRFPVFYLSPLADTYSLFNAFTRF